MCPVHAQACAKTSARSCGEGLERHPRFKVPVTPTSSSWTSLVGRLFAGLTADVIRTGSFVCIAERVRDIEADHAERNANPRADKRMAKGAEIFAKIKRARIALDKAEAA